MKYDEKNDLIVIGVREAVAIARRKISSTLPCDADEPSSYPEKNADGDAAELTMSFECKERKFLLKADGARERDGGIYVYTEVNSSPKHPGRETVMQARGEGFLTAFMLCERDGVSEVEIEYVYRNPSTDVSSTVSEICKRDTLEKFFEKCKMSIIVYAEPEIERVTVRLPSMKKVKFPYGQLRSGQSEIVHGVYKNIARGGRLFVSAPTGTGKTVSVLFPAVRALGNEKCDKVFYFTPKTTTAEAARDTISDICTGGVRICSVILASKERTCKNGLVCRENRNKCKNLSENRLSEATLKLYEMRLSVIGAKEIETVAESYSVCPHELSLSYAELCDIIILDINYLFDPHVSIKRFFSQRGDFAFLIDEAHNLPERAREIYSCAITLSDIRMPSKNPIIGEHSRLKDSSATAADMTEALLLSHLEDDITVDNEGIKKGATSLHEVPIELYDIFSSLIADVEDEIMRCRKASDEEAEIRTRLVKDYYYAMRDFYEAISRFDSSYELFIFLNGEELCVKCFCLDPGAEISKRLSIGGSATFFSGTLSPIYYYKSVLGTDRSAEVIETESPFDSGQLSVSIMDKISTRLSERERTLDAVVKAIAATVSAKKGNYMVFSPSFAYLEAIASRFSAKYPKVRVMLQRRDMTRREKDEFLESFSSSDGSYLVGFSVLGGIYSEGVDFSGESLIGAIVVGIGIPSLSYEREAMSAYYQDRFDEGKEFAYIYPGINKVLQAAGRVIRTEEDRGVIVLIDDRFADPLYKRVIPRLWSTMKFIDTPIDLRKRLDLFWSEEQ